MLIILSECSISMISLKPAFLRNPNHEEIPSRMFLILMFAIAVSFTLNFWDAKKN